MSVLPLKADIRQREWRVRNVPLADIAADEWQANALAWKVLFRCIRIQEVENGCFKLLVCHFQHIQHVLLCL
jgi:hypothetical protein